jgi:hypothetical protein
VNLDDLPGLTLVIHPDRSIHAGPYEHLLGVPAEVHLARRKMLVRADGVGEFNPAASVFANQGVFGPAVILPE